MTSVHGPNHPRTIAMREALKEARDLLDKRDFTGAKRVLDQLGVEMNETGQSSASYDWTMGVALDYLDDEERAMAFLERAQVADPIAHEISRSIEVVLNNARRTLATAGLPINSPRIAVLYGVLHRRDAADRNAHLLFARHQLAIGKPAEARSLLEAMTRLYYPAADIYALLADCAEGMGDANAAASARAESGRLGGADAAAAAVVENDVISEKSSRRPRVRPS
jgi:tetratricopeptide (TPR) repeat protein